MPTLPLERSTRFIASREQVSTTVGAEAVILGMRDGVYYGLDGTGVRIWALLQTERSLGEVSDLLAAEYEVESNQAWHDLCALTQELLVRGLVERSAAPAP